MVEQFEAKFVRVPEGGCWIWMAALNNKGYGVCTINRKQMYAHRASYQMTHGAIPEGMHVLHRCDNPACVNPHHLFIGTHQDNMQDMANKGRRKGKGHNNGPKGEGVHFAKLTDGDVLEIRRRYVMGLQKMQELAEEFGTSQPVVSRIINRKIWKHI